MQPFMQTSCWQMATKQTMRVASSSRLRRAHRFYGRLGAFNPSGRFLPQERGVLETYGRLAAAALDSATALDDARRDANTARVLLELSTALAEIISVDEVAGQTRARRSRGNRLRSINGDSLRCRSADGPCRCVIRLSAERGSRTARPRRQGIARRVSRRCSLPRLGSWRRDDRLALRRVRTRSVP